MGKLQLNSKQRFVIRIHTDLHSGRSLHIGSTRNVQNAKYQIVVKILLEKQKFGFSPYDIFWLVDLPSYNMIIWTFFSTFFCFTFYLRIRIHSGSNIRMTRSCNIVLVYTILIRNTDSYIQRLVWILVLPEKDDFFTQGDCHCRRFGSFPQKT